MISRVVADDVAQINYLLYYVHSYKCTASCSPSIAASKSRSPKDNECGIVAAPKLDGNSTVMPCEVVGHVRCVVVGAVSGVVGVGVVSVGVVCCVVVFGEKVGGAN